LRRCPRDRYRVMSPATPVPVAPAAEVFPALKDIPQGREK
jgi:hypothetical protein